MNKLRLFPIALTALVLGSCSSEDVIDNGGNGSVLPGEKGYISLGINLPTTPSTRAENDKFDDGTANEYAVKDATLIVFTGDAESTATVTGVYTLTLHGSTNVGSSTDNITTSYQLTQEVTKPGDGNNLYALVVLNKGGVTLDESIKGKHLSDFTGTVQTDDFLDGTNILMTNAPLSKTKGGSAVPTGNLVTLTEIAPENVFTTEAEAKANPAADIYVERALAKVTVTTVTGNSYNVDDDTNPTITAEIKGWALDVTNKESYLVRNMTDANWWSYNASKATDPETGVNDDYRFVGSDAVSTDPELYRTYWGIDPNYNTTYEATKFNMLGGTTLAASQLKATGETNALYCKENTFDVANMIQDRTTRVIVAAKIEVPDESDNKDNDGTFYTLDNNKDVFYNTTNIVKQIKAYFLTNKDVAAYLDENKNLLNKPLDENSLTVHFDKTTADGKVTGGEVTVESIDIDKSIFTNGEVPAELKEGGTGTTTPYSSALTEINSHNYSCYKGGIAYYPVMIKHFGDDLTKWNAANKTESYPNPDKEAKWLGRYGVLRNNWYNIDVTAIKSIGYAEVPTVQPNFDDPVESWISVKINVLSWAKRTQNVEL